MFNNSETKSCNGKEQYRCTKKDWLTAGGANLFLALVLKLFGAAICAIILF